MKNIKKNMGKNGVPQQQYDADKDLVAKSGASFIVKYLGYEEVKEARGVKVCSLAAAKLIKDKKNKKKMTLMISMDGVRVVDEMSRVLVLDQPIEKISFCAPDSQNPKLFSYIARDGPCRRWLCYGFYATEVPGERLSHALGCAFTACLQRKQRAGAECNSMGSSKGSTENSPAKPRPQPKANTTTITRPPPIQITVPIPDFSRNRSATTIGISTPPTQSAIQQRNPSNPFVTDSDQVRGQEFTANLADILLFDPTEEVPEQSETRRRAATDLPTGSSLDEFDPLHPTFKMNQFEDNFQPFSQPSRGHVSDHVTFSNTNPFAAPATTLPPPFAAPATKLFDDFDMFASSRIAQR